MLTEIIKKGGMNNEFQSPSGDSFMLTYKYFICINQSGFNPLAGILLC